ncbi:MAG TPA: LytTR family DNA-binding domain-containing protein [Negativicutes bacterium]|nr:LytTR family DNA-binding domain-containing protein [Negativicutes bacterium]
MRLKALIVDDEFPAREELACMLAETGAVEVAGTCEDGEEALAFLQERPVDVVFLDIQMPTMDGLSAARGIMSLADRPRVVFTTGFSEHAVKAFELDAIDYLVKPYAKDRLERTVKKLQDYYGGEETDVAPNGLAPVGVETGGKLPVWSNGRLILLNVADIFFAKAAGKRNTLINARKGEFSTSTTLRELEIKLSKANFVRTHKSYLVNAAQIEEVVPWFNNTYLLILQDCPVRDIPVARHYVRDFNLRMNL